MGKEQIGKLKDYISKVNETMGTYNFDIYDGFHYEYPQIILSDIEQLISYLFNRQNFSERLWKQKNYLQSKLKEVLTTVLVLGENPARLSKDFAQYFKARECEGYRLLHTETSFVMEKSALSYYNESDTVEVPAGITYKEWKEKYFDTSKEKIIIKVLKENNIKGKPVFDARPIDLKDYKFDDIHINKEREHHVVREEAEGFMNNALIGLKRWNGRFLNYYSENGAVYIDTQKKEIRTAFSSDEYDEKMNAWIKKVKEFE